MCCALFVTATAVHAATDFSDYSVFTSASSTTLTTIKIGATTDSEAAITANTTATGDDITGTDDEDGVTLPASVALGVASSMTVNVTNTSGATVYLNVWIDFNRNGVLTDAGEQVAANTVIATGTSGSNKTVSFTVPATATVGTAGVRVRLTSTSTPGSTGLSGNGEVEDNIMTLTCPAVSFSPTTLTTPTVGSSTSQSITASGPSTTFTYAVTSGTLPSGLSLSSAGVISGTPTSSATANFTVTATGANTCAGSQAYTVTPVCPTISLSPAATAIPDAYVGSAFTQAITASGGTSSYTYAVTSGTLPSGLALSTSGVLSGTPSIGNGAGTNVTIRATDANGCQGSLTYTVQVCPVISLSPTTLSTPTVTTAYSQTIAASGGASAYTYAISTGSLPAGLSLDTSAGVISGTPTSTSSATFTVGVTDANACLASRSYTLTPAANTDYSDYSGFGNASSTTNSNLRLGATVDIESTATTNTSATGDDITGIDDEDGVTVPASLMLNSAGTLTVNVTNTTGATAFLNAWIDYNQNGVLTDSGEQIATNTVIATGTSNSNKTISFTVPTAATLGTTGVRVRLTSTSSPGSTGASGNGEVEDYTVVIAPSLGVGNMIWNDANENGLLDAGESGIDNVLVELWTPGADNAIGGTGTNADTKVSSMTSAGGGLYNFSGLTTGYYFVKVPTPPLSRTSLVVDTTDNGQDGDNNGSQPGGSGTSAYSPVIQLIPGTEPGSTGSTNIDNTIDFGFAANIGSPFVCDNRFWIIQNAETSPGSGVYDTTLYYVGTGPSLVPAFFFSGYKLNGLAAYGGYLYCVDQNDNHLYRINSQGILVDMGAIPGLPSPGTNGQWSGATALTNGRMILNLYNFTGSTQLYTIDLTSASLVGSPVTVTNSGTGTTYAGNFGDIVWDPLTGNVYGYSTVDTSWLGLFQINLTTGVGTRVSSAVPGAWGSMIIDANGLTYGFGSAGATGNQDTLYVFNRTSNVLNGSITAVGTGPSVSSSDGAACPGAAPSMKMGNLVWNDVNNNGIKDSSEAGIDGVTLQLFLGGQNPLTAAPAATVTTAGGGLYSFSNLSPGQYFIYMPTPPAAFPLSSTTTVTLDNGVDNDDNGIQTSQGLPVQSPLIALAGGTESITDGDTDSNTDLTIDFGFLACPAITVNPASIAAATVGAAYSQTFTASGGTTPYTWTVSTGTLPAGLTLSTAGVLSGTPSSNAATSFTICATDKNGCLGTRAYTLTPVCTAITVTTSSLPTATVGTAYSQTFGVSGGTTPYTWAVSSGTLPAGLALSSAGVLSGTPTAGNAGGTNVTFTVTDKYGCQQSTTLNLQVCPVVSLSPTTLTAPTVGTAYSQTITATGGSASYAYTLASGTLPTGLTLSGAGVISGTPTNVTSATFTVKATDANGCPGTRAYTLAAVCPTITVTPTTVPDSFIGTAYSQTLTASGGTASYTWAVSSGTLPAGLTLSTGGVISGTPTTTNAAGVNVTFRATDTYGCQGTAVISIQVCPVINVSPATLTTATQGAAYSQPLTASGGASAYSYAISSGTLPAGLTLSGAGVISGTPTASNGSGTTLTFLVTDANGCQASFIRTLQVCPVITLSPSTLTAPVVGTAYSQTITASGGSGSYTYTLASGTLPTWATLSSSGVFSGTPTSTAAATFTVRATDGNLCAGTLSYTVTPVCPAISITPTSLTKGTVGTAYSQALAASGGIAPYGTWTITSGTLPAGLTLSASTGVISGTPTAAASPLATVTVRVNDANGCQGSQAVTLQICPVITLAPSTPATGIVGTAYSQTITASGGAAAYTFALASGTLPPGLSLNTSTGVVNGTPTTQISSNVTLRATDANGCQGTLAVTFAISCPVITVTPAALAQGTVGSAYSQTVSATGGSSSYVFAIASGTLSAGLTLNTSTGVISGTPTTSNAGGTGITVSATDSFNCSGTKSYTLQVCPVITLSPASFTTPTVGTAYSQTVTASGGAASYTYTLASGSLPAWATLSPSGVLSGTPNSTTAATFTVKATDANGCAGTLSYSLSPVCPAISITPASLAQGTVGTAYSQTLAASGGIAPYSSWTLTSGTLPTGLTLSASTGVISGTPTAAASPLATVTVRVNDANGCQGSQAVTLQICPVVTLSPATLTTPTVGTAYSQTITASGGATAYTYSLASGTLPAWATLSASGVISGTPTNTTSATFTVRATDANGCSGTLAYTVTPVCPAITLTPAALAQGTVGSAYSQTLTASGGITPYSTWTITSGTLPAGLTLNASTGVISGTPTATASPATTITFRVNDANGCQGSRAITLQICPVVTLSPATLPTPTVGTAYSQTITASGGAGAYTYSLASGSLPAWATLSSSGVLSGTPNSTASSAFTVRASDANGCAGTLAYTVAPVCPAISVTTASLAQGTMGITYSQTLAASGGALPYTWSIATGSLPAGLTLSAGVISGTPTATGTSSFTVQVADTYGCATTRSLSITIVPPTTDFGDYPIFPSASQTASTEVFVGTNATDVEPVNPTTGLATADDTTGTDDEDLVIPSVVSGGDLNMSIPVTLSGSVTLGRIGIWADWNGDGDTLDTNETVVLSSSALIGGSNNITATFSPPAGTTVGTKYLRIIAVEGTTAPAFSGPSSLKGEVEDYAITVTTPTLDYGDLPDPIIGTSASNYQTLSNDNGPASIASTALRLGAGVSAEGNGQPNSTATGDTFDDGVATLPSLTQNLPATLTITATNSFGSAGFLKAWIDWNNDGNLSSDEELGTEISVPNGTSGGSFSFTFTVPSTAVIGANLGLRVRLASVTIPASNGVVGTGEVEDYLVTVNASTVDFGDYPNFAAASRVASTLIKVGTAATDVETSNPTSGNATVDDTTGTDDEDLTMPTLLAGTNGTLTIPVTLVSPITTGRIAVFADWNGDNLVTGTNETVTLSTANLVTGANSITATLSPPLGITGGVKFLRIVVTEGTTGSPFSGSSTLRGEVEDYAVTVNAYTLDFGDLPDTSATTSTGNYPTLNAHSGPSHTINANTLRLGATVDAEADGQPNATATGDGADEDSISSMPVFYRGQGYTIPVSVFNNTGGTARLFGFIDWNNDGDFLDAGEALTAVTVSSSASQQSLNITGTTPGITTVGTFGARFRLATATTLASTGTTADGEVEDYIVTGACPTVTITPASLPTTTQYSSYNQTLSASGGTTPYTWTITTGALPGGLTMSSAGIFSGTVVSASGAYVFTARASDANGCAASQSYTISVGSGGMSVGNLVFLDENNNGLKDSTERGIPNVPVEIWSAGADGRVNSADDQAVTSGNASVLTTGGMLSAGTFGTIASGFSTLTARSDWTGAYQFTELPTGVYYLKITPPSKAVFSSKYSTGTTTFSLNLDFPLASAISVLLDNGIDNDNNGVQTTGSFVSSADAVVAGVGAAVYSMPFTLATATEPGTSNLGSDEYTIDFGLRPCPAIGITPLTVPAVSSGVAYTTTLTSSGGISPYTYAITQGTLPSGLSISTAGVISGTTSTAGTSAITIRSTDARGCQGFTTIQLTVTTAMSVSTASLPNGTEGTSYTSTTVAATGGTTPYQNWRVSSGTLPAGLAISSSTGLLSGTPTTPGTYVFTVAVDDALVTPASVTVTNGSVETDAWSAITFVPRTTVTGWTLGNSALTGTTTAVQLYGVNNTNPNNTQYGGTPAGSQYLASPFVGSWASQTVSGFTVGRPYTLRVRYAMRGAFANPTTTEAQPPFYGDALWISGYNASAASLFGPVNVNFPVPTAANYDNWATLDIPFVPQTASMVFSYGLDGAAIDDVQFIPTVAASTTASKQFTVVISGNRDWGDLPDTGIGTGTGNYQTTNSDSGPSHYRDTNLRLGATLDIEPDGQPNATATGDDINGTADEDSITSLPVFARGKSFTIPVSVFNNIGSSASVFGFIDWNNDGDFLDPFEALTSVSVSSSASQQSVNITGTVPGNAVLAQIGFRVRLSTAGTLGAFGLATNGEVEDYLVTTSCPAVSLSPTSLTAGTLSTAYSQTITASGGTASYSYAVASGTLPSGLTLNASTGVLSGTPNVAGTYSFTLSATDANGCSGTQTYTVVTSCPTLSITPASLTTGTVGTAYSQTLAATGGATPYGSWTVTSGSLPAGLTLSSAGVISGTPTTSTGSAVSFTVRTTDANGCQGSQGVTLQICPVLTLSPTTLAAATVNTAYSQTLTTSGSATSYTYTLSSGTLPAGVSLSSAGVLSGTPTSTTSRTFTISATDANGCPGSRSYTIAPVCPTIAITPVTATRATVGVAYSQTLSATGGLAPYGSWAVTSGTLPAGLTLNASTGVISGTATTANSTGTSVTFRAADANGCTGSQAVTMQVCPVITLSPSTLPNGTINTAYSQTITASGGTASYTYTVSSGALPAGLTLSPAGLLSGTPTSATAASFTLTATDANGCSGTLACTVTPAPDSDYSDYSLFSGASSRMNSTLRIGALTDVEAAATTNTAASGDDITGVDDEDGVTLPASFTQGGAASFTVNVTNTSGASAFLNAWIDFNQNGSLSDAGEQIAINTLIATGTSNSNKTISFTAPASAVLGSAGVRVRLTSTSSPGSVGASGNGEVEDNVATIVAPTTDYGDFSLFTDAWSTGSGSLKLGPLQDLEGSSTKDASAMGDDNTGVDDEDSVTFPSMTAGQPMSLPVTVTNLTGSTAYLNAWIDYNNNGVLTDAGEQIATNVNVITGTNGGTITLNFTVPTNAVTAAALIGTRFRLTNVATPGSTGGVGTGEVEDHTVVILAPLTDFGDFSGAPSVSNTASSNLRLGALVDTEYAATTDATATGDDLTGVDDEDGVTIPAMTAGAPATIPVVVSNNTGAVGYLNAWIDYNNNGVFTDTGEQIASNTTVVTGTTNSTVNLSITVPPTVVTGANLGVRVRISNDVSPGSTGAGGVGEVEDYIVNIAVPTTDFGDYSLFGLVSSTVDSRLKIGTLTDTEYVATTNTTATGDDITGLADEDGVTLPPSMIAGGPATLSAVVTNTIGSTAYLNAWIDFNGNGVLTDAGEQIAANLAVGTGSTNSSVGGTIIIPATALTGVNLGMRVMFTTAASPSTSGSVGTGEIEDYVIVITAPTTDFGDFSSFADASQGVSPGLRMGSLIDAEYASTKNATATGDDITNLADEDGVTLPSMTAGQTLTIPVVITNSTGALGYLNAWIDFNNNGVLTDSGEQIATNINVPTGSADTTFTINVTVPLAAVTGTNVGARFRLSAPTSPGPTGANAAVGEIEDYVVNIIAPTIDFGDFSGIGSASSTANSKLKIGALVDAEYAATMNAAASGDDITGVDDEDGVTIPTLTSGSSATIPVVVTNTTGASAYLNAWIDYNNNGVLTDAGEQIATNTAIVTGTSNVTKNVTFTVPVGAVAGTPVGVRVRLTAVSSPGSIGLSSGSGEVEDNIVSIVGPTSDYGDWSGIADASNTVVSSLRLGALTDAEFSSTKNATATGDDITYLADEDGVALPAMTAGGTFTVPVIVTNTSGSAAFLNAWIDFNNNGSFADAGEQFATNVNVATGSANATLNQSIAVPTAAVTGTNLGVRVRLTSASTPGSTGTGGGNGEVEDYVANIAAPTTDFGDFSLFPNASSTKNSNLRLGALTDTEYLATTNTTATGDDITGLADEDGVTLPSMTAGAPATIPVAVTNNTGSSAFLNAWIDYNNNGVLTDAGEQIATNLSIATGTTSGTQNLSITVPPNAVTGTNIGVRVRLTSVSSPGSTGAAGNGEVEDYIVNIITPPLDYGDWIGIADAASNATTALRLGALVDTEYVSTRNAAATGDDITGSADEDGVALPAMIAGAPATIPVIVTNTTGSTAFLNVWIDFNNNGVLTDAGEQIATNTSIATGTTNATRNISITVPAGAVTGSNIGVRVRLTDVASPGVTGTAGNGEVEDYVTSIAVPSTDFGDWNGAPDASSLASSNLRMGALADTEYVSTLNASATGDDITGSDDEDGVTIPSQVPGTAGSATVVVTNNSGAAGYLNGWIDFNNNGSFTDSGEQIATNTSIATGTNGVTQTVNFIVPVTAVPGQRGARFRLTSTQNPTSVGASGMGEVEDNLVTITCLPIALSPTTLTTPTVGTAFSQTVTASGGLAPYSYSIGSGTLPAGLALSSTGTVSGTPTSSSAATFTIVATDAYSCSGTQSYTVTPVCPTITVNPSTLPSGIIGTAYSQTLTASGGTAAYTFAVSSGTLPAGLTLNATSGVLSGTPTTSNAGGVNLTFRATDANSCSGTRTINLIICPVITLTPATLTTPTVGTAYSQTLAGSGGAASYTFTLASGSLPTWATLSPSGVLSGTPNSTTAATFTVRATDANGCSGTLSYTVTPVCPTITITPASLAQGTVGTAYSQTLSATGGIAPYSAWTITSGSLPAGLSLSASTGVISGTPTATASPATTITFRVNDANGCQGSRTITLQICPVITLTPTTLPTPIIGSAYSQSVTASGGIASYTYALASGSLPAWATLSPAGAITGTPTNATPATFTVRATDANGCAGTLACTLAPNCPTISILPTTAAQSTVGSAYSQTLTASGGTSPYGTWTVTSGTLPAGLSLNASTGVISGTPTTSNAGGVSVSIRASDANGCQGTQAITFQVCPVITLAPTTPATPTVSTAYSQTFTASGGAASYNYSLASGTLPTWATLSTGGVLSGTPDSPNSATFTLRATDANGCSGTQGYTITPACPTMSISPLTAATGTVGSAYSQTLSGSGGTGPYGSWTVTSGTLPAGLSLSASGVISGTPTASTGAATSFIVRTTDARGCQVSATISLKICPVVTLSPTTLAASTAGSSYSQTITASGGVAAYAYTVSSGTLPAGLTLSSAGALTGTPTSTSAASFTITATDANGCGGTRAYTLTPACPTITVSPSTLTNGMVNSAYSQTVTSSGGVGTVTFSISSGSLPAGLSLNSTTGLISGTPTSTTAATFTVRATDSNACTGTTTYTVTPACPAITVGPSTLTTGGVGVAYSQALSPAGGIAPYGSWTVTSGTLPAGLTLNSTSGIISGTPTTSNGTGVNVTIRTSDANGCQGSSTLSIKICPVITQSPATPAAPVIGVAYTQTITAAGGVSAYTFTLVSGALPSGMTLSSSGTISGTTTSSASASFTLKATAADGCSGTTSYTLTPVCPTLSLSPATLPIAYLGASYTQALTASGATAPYTFALQSGDLPGGVLLSSTGTLSGTPSAKGSFPITVRVTDANSCAQSFNLTLQVHTLSIGNLVFEDSNNNGLKDSGEPGVANATVQLFSTGDDNAIGGSGTAADTQVGSSFTTDATGAYLFSLLPAGNFYVKVTPPSDYLFTGGTASTSDNDIDNNNDGAQPGGSGTPLFSPVINLSGGAESITDGDSDPDTNLTVDFGLWSSVAVGNSIFLDINGDGHRNEGESLGNIYVELYAQGTTPGVDSPVSAGTSGCSCKGRYYLDGVNPGTYFLFIPASQFTTGAPLEGLLPMPTVVPGDDDVGQDLLFNSNPAVNGASTGLFTLRPGFCPVGSAESGMEGTIDDAIDARVDLTRDLGVVAPAGTGFAASETIRRYIITGGFTASVLPGATTFALWSQGSTIGSATADPDEDGLPNLLEYALGTDPASPLQSNRFTLTHDASIVALLTQPAATHDDLIISLETLTDLSKAADASAWKKLSMAATTTINADGTLTRSYSNLEKLLVFKGLDAGYIRLRVDLDANRDGVPEATVTSAVQGWGRQTFATGARTFSMPLLNASFFTGRAVSASANEIMLPAIITLPAGSLYLEALDGPLVGQRFDIDATASSGNTVVLQNTSQSYAGLVNAHICIRLHHTLAELLPPASFSSDDRTLFFESTTSSYTTLTNSSGSWFSDVLSMNTRPFAAHEAALVQVRGSGTVLMLTGEVRLTSYVTPLVAGTQLIAPGWPVATPAPVTGLTSGLSPDTADRFRLWDGDTTPASSSYTGYYLDGSTTPAAWLPQTLPAPAATIQPFHGYFLIRTAPLQMNQSAPW